MDNHDQGRINRLIQTIKEERKKVKELEEIIIFYIQEYESDEKSENKGIEIGWKENMYSFYKKFKQLLKSI